MSGGKQIGAQSRLKRLRQLDGRTGEARMLKAFEADLVKALGGNPNPLQQKQSRRCAMLQFRLFMLDKKISDQGGDGALLDASASKYYLAWHGALERSLQRLSAMGGKASKRPAGPSLAEYLATKQVPAA